jgi:hypothetical protein
MQQPATHSSSRAHSYAVIPGDGPQGPGGAPAWDLAASSGTRASEPSGAPAIDDGPGVRLPAEIGVATFRGVHPTDPAPSTSIAVRYKNQSHSSESGRARGLGARTPLGALESRCAACCRDPGQLEQGGLVPKRMVWWQGRGSNGALIIKGGRQERGKRRCWHRARSGELEARHRRRWLRVRWTGRPRCRRRRTRRQRATPFAQTTVGLSSKALFNNQPCRGSAGHPPRSRQYQSQPPSESDLANLGDGEVVDSPCRCNQGTPGPAIPHLDHLW